MLNMINRGRMEKATTDEFEALFSRLNGIFARLFDSDGIIIQQPVETEWISPSFSAGNFTASGSMTWTVGSGDVVTYAYTIIGNIMTVAFVLNTTTVGGTPSTALKIAIPNHRIAAKTIFNPVLVIDNGTRTTGYASVSVNGTSIDVSRTDAANWAASVNNTYLFGQLTFEVLP